MARLVERALELVLALAVTAAVALSLALHLAPFAGYQPYAVRSGSMAPALEVGDLAIGERVPADAIRAGDIVARALPGGPTIAHRVVTVGAGDDGPRITTRGDANAANDPVAATAAEIRGRIAWRVPAAGYLVATLSTPSGSVAVLSIIATFLVALWLVRDARAADEEAALERELAELREVLASRAAAPRWAPSRLGTP